jgi:hypothetical protein
VGSLLLEEGKLFGLLRYLEVGLGDDLGRRLGLRVVPGHLLFELGELGLEVKQFLWD